MNYKIIDFIAGTIIIIMGFLLITISDWFYLIGIIIGTNLSIGLFRYFYNKKTRKWQYWRKQRKLWNSSNTKKKGID